MPHVLVWDIETVPDLAGFAAANGHDGKTPTDLTPDEMPAGRRFSGPLPLLWLFRGSHLRLFLSGPMLRPALDRRVNSALKSLPSIGAKLYVR